MVLMFLGPMKANGKRDGAPKPGVRSGLATGLEADVCFETGLLGGQSEFLVAMLAAFAFAALLGLPSFHVVVCPCATLLFLGAASAFAALMGWPSGSAADGPAVRAALSDGFGAAMLAVSVVFSDGYGAAMLGWLLVGVQVGSCAESCVPGSSSLQLDVESRLETVSEVGAMVMEMESSASEFAPGETEANGTESVCLASGETEANGTESVCSASGWSNWRPGSLDPWSVWQPGSLPVISEEVSDGPDPEDPLYEWVTIEDPLESFFHSLMTRCYDVESDSGSVVSEILYSGGVLGRGPATRILSLLKAFEYCSGGQVG